MAANHDVAIDVGHTVNVVTYKRVAITVAEVMLEIVGFGVVTEYAIAIGANPDFATFIDADTFSSTIIRLVGRPKYVVS